MLVKLLIVSAFYTVVTPTFTFRNVMVTCDSENPSDDEIPFGTVVTTNRLKPHLPSNLKCYKISIQYATIPVINKDALADINNVRYLLLENDGIEELEPGAFTNLKVKEAMSLKSNRIREIRRGVFNDVQVPILFLSYNYISYIDYQAFDNMTILESVHLDHNQLTRIDSFWFRNCPKMNKLNFQYNQIQQVPRFAFQNLGANKFSSPSIDLSYNMIRNVDGDALGGLKKIHFLSLASNRITNLDKTWIKGVKVNTLDISSNNIYCINDGLSEPYSTIYIDNNPWNCECLQGIKSKECRIFGRIMADDALEKCNIIIEKNTNCM